MQAQKAELVIQEKEEIDFAKLVYRWLKPHLTRIICDLHQKYYNRP